MNADRIAILSDIHGNLTALEAALAHIKAAGITRIFNLGDLVGKGPRPAEVVDRCRAECEVTVQGNWDALVSDGPDPAQPGRQWHRQQLGTDRLAYLAALPASFDFMLSGRAVRLFHASQTSVFHRVRQTGTRDQHRAMFQNTPFTGFDCQPSIVGYGDIHTAYSINFEHRTLFNVGSVGNPLDHPLACYAVLEGTYGTAELGPWSLQFTRLSYDIEAEIAVAKASGMPDLHHYASELRTAVYRGLTPPTAPTEA